MKEATRRPLRKELEAMLTEGLNQELVDYAERTQSQLLSDWVGGDSQAIRKELRYTSALAGYGVRYLQETDEARYAAVRLGALAGTVECFERILYEQDQNVWAEMRFAEESVKHLPEVVQALETHGPMSHAELAKHLGMKTSTLTEGMKKILPTGAVRASTMGKYKMYSLSDAGLRYGKELRKKQRQDASLAEVAGQIDRLLEDAPDQETREAVRSALRERLGGSSGMEVCIGDTWQMYDQDKPIGKMKVEWFANIFGCREKVVGGSLETELDEETNIMPEPDESSGSLLDMIVNSNTKVGAA